jgi:hypothetical protein
MPEHARPTYGLDQLRADVESDYGPFVFDLPGQPPAVFLPVMRLSRAARDRVFALMDVVAGDDAEAQETGSVDTTRINPMLDALKELLAITSRGDSAARLFTALAAQDPPMDDDPAVLLRLWSGYQEVTQPGEASDSDDSSTSTEPPSPGTSPEPDTTSGTSSETWYPTAPAGLPAMPSPYSDGYPTTGPWLPPYGVDGTGSGGMPQ